MCRDSCLSRRAGASGGAPPWYPNPLNRPTKDPALAVEGERELMGAVEARDAGREGVLATLRGVPI